MRQKRRVVIVAGGDFNATDAAKILPEHDVIIAADGGAAKLIQYDIWPDVLVGDMDTLKETEWNKLKQKKFRIDRLPVEKDVTDTHYACELALANQPKEVALFGVWGGARMDHALANVGLLEWFCERGVDAKIYAGTNRVRLLEGPAKTVLPKENFHFLSLLPLSSKVEGIDTIGLKYTLKNGVLKRGLTRGISNEWVEDEAIVHIRQGKLLIVETSD